MKKAKIRPLVTPKPINWSSPKLTCVISSRTCMQNFVAIGSGVSAPPNTWFRRAFGVTRFFWFWGSSTRLQPIPLNEYLRKLRQKTSFRVRKCLLGVPITIFDIYTLKIPKTAIFGQILTGQFFPTESRFNMGMLQCKTTLNRHPSPIKVI